MYPATYDLYRETGDYLLTLGKVSLPNERSSPIRRSPTQTLKYQPILEEIDKLTELQAQREQLLTKINNTNPRLPELALLVRLAWDRASHIETCLKSSLQTKQEMPGYDVKNSSPRFRGKSFSSEAFSFLDPISPPSSCQVFCDFLLLIGDREERIQSIYKNAFKNLSTLQKLPLSDFQTTMNNFGSYLHFRVNEMQELVQEAEVLSSSLHQYSSDPLMRAALAGQEALQRMTTQTQQCKDLLDLLPGNFSSHGKEHFIQEAKQAYNLLEEAKDIEDTIPFSLHSNTTPSKQVTDLFIKIRAFPHPLSFSLLEKVSLHYPKLHKEFSNLALA